MDSREATLSFRVLLSASAGSEFQHSDVREFARTCRECGVKVRLELARA